MSNEFLPFATAGGANVESQGSYSADSSRSNGNQPGIASSALNNKALRQGTFVSAQLAQLASDFTATDTVDDGVAAHFLSQLKAAIQALPPKLNTYLSSTGNHNNSYYFFIATGSASTGATYTNNAVTYTVISTVASGTLIQMSGNGAPTASGTLTKSGGSGDATLTFYAVRAPIYLKVRLIGAGGGGAGSSTVVANNGGTGGTGGDTTFGTALLSAGGGGGGHGTNAGAGGSGGTSSLGSGPVGIVITGGIGGGSLQLSATSGYVCAGQGGNGAFGGGGGSAPAAADGTAGATNTGGGGGGGAVNVGTAANSGAGGGSGGYVDALISTVLSTYAYAIGAAGTAGSAGSGGQAGAAGGSGMIEVVQYYQ